MRLLVCGDRDWDDYSFLAKTLSRLHKKFGITLIIQGKARGADTMAKKWGKKKGIPVKGFAANWDKYKLAAGPIRNRKMLKKGKPDRVIGFHNNIKKSKGTKDMLAISKKAGLPTKCYSST